MTENRLARERADCVARARSAVHSAAGIGVVVLLLSAALPAGGAAQINAAVAGHVGRSGAVPGALMMDVAGEVGQGPLALRAGVGMDAVGTPLAPMLSSDGATSGLWTADVDAGINVGRVPLLDRLFGGMNPTAFVGAGVAGVTTTDPFDGTPNRTVVPTWTYGARAGVPLISWLSIEGEARHRAALGDVSVEDYPVRDDWEYRVGFALRFGGAPRATAPRASTPRGTVTGRGSRSDRGTRTVGRDERRAASAAEIADNAIGLGERYIGTPYVWGGESPSGFDCSGFVQYVYRRQGIELPRVSRDQARAGRALSTSLSGISRGDLLFFASDGRTVSHVAIYAGDGRILHSSSSGRGVRYDDLRGSRGGWYVNHLVGVRRVIEDGYYRDDAFAGADAATTMPGRALPLDDAFEALVGDRGDEDAPN